MISPVSLLILKKTKRLPIIRTFRHLGEYTKDNFCFKLLENTENFNLILDTDDVNRQVDVFTSTFIICLDACAPYVTMQVKLPFAPWMSGCLREAMNLRDDTKKKLKSDRYNIALQKQYKHEKKRVITHC